MFWAFFAEWPELLCSSVATHVSNFEHALSILLHEVHFVSVGAINVLHAVTQIVFLGVEMLELGH